MKMEENDDLMKGMENSKSKNELVLRWPIS